MEGTEDNVVTIAEMVNSSITQSFLRLTFPQIQKGVSGARSDDTKSLKGSVLDWIAPRGQLNPPLARNVKIDRGFHHECTGFLLCPTGMDWSDPV